MLWFLFYFENWCEFIKIYIVLYKLASIIYIYKTFCSGYNFHWHDLERFIDLSIHGIQYKNDIESKNFPECIRTTFFTRQSILIGAFIISKQKLIGQVWRVHLFGRISRARQAWIINPRRRGSRDEASNKRAPTEPNRSSASSPSLSRPLALIRILCRLQRASAAVLETVESEVWPVRHSESI